MNSENINRCLSDDSFLSKIDQMQTVEEFNKALNDEGADITLDETNNLLKKVELSVAENNEELNSDQLAGVAGGGWKSTWEDLKWGWNAGKKLALWMRKRGW